MPASSSSAPAAAPTAKRSRRPKLKREARVKGLGTRKVKTRRRRLSGQTRKSTENDGPALGASTSTHACPICHDEYSTSTFPVVHAPCGHVACASCSLQWQEKKSARTCALCRTQVLSIAHCPLLEQLLEKRSPAVDPSTAVTETTAAATEATRDEIKKSLRELGLCDLGDMPADYRAHIVRAAASRAIRKSDLGMFEKCLQKYKARPSTNLLCIITEEWKGDPRAVLSLMVQHGARLNGHCEDRPMLAAASRGNIKMMSALLEMKADPSLPTGPSGESALHIACRSGRFEAVRMLLDHGVAADLPDRLGRTPLSCAEKGKERHMAACAQGHGCERCESRIQVLGELKWRVKAIGDSSAPPTLPPGESAPPVIPNDEESAGSSSEWEGSSSGASDLSDWDTEDEAQMENTDMECESVHDSESGEEENDSQDE